MSFAVITDSASNLTVDLLTEYDIDMVSFHYQLNGELIQCYDPNKNYIDEAKKFYDELRKGSVIKTSLISPSRYYDCFKKHLDQGEDILYISISAKLSGTYNSSCNARDILLDEYKDRKIICIDSFSASFGEAIIAIEAAKCRKKGISLEETVDFISGIRMNIRNEFTVDNLIYLKRTGRISSLVYSIGALLDIKPLLRASVNADIESCGKVRGRKKALITMCKTVCDNIIRPEDQTIFIAHCDAESDAQLLANMIKQNITVKDIYINYYDLCTGAHVGPGTIAIFYYGNERQPK